MVTAKAFADQCMIPYNDGWGYIYGTWGSLWTEKKQKSATRPQTVKYGSKWIGKMVTDCSGLPRWALYQLGYKSLLHHAYYQYTDCCKNKGQLIDGARADGQPIKRGTAVFLKGNGERIHHVGVYVGNGDVVEAKGTQYGVVMSKLSHWDHWGEYKAVDYSAEEGDKPTMRALKKGCRGDDVRELQEMLNKIGYDCGTADGIFGTKTEKAVKRFQEAEGLEADGIAGEKTQEILAARAADPDVPELPEDDDEIDEPQHIMVDCVELMTARDYMAKALNKIDKMLKEGGMQP